MTHATILPANSETTHPSAVMIVAPRANAPAIFQRVYNIARDDRSIVATVLASGFMSASIFSTRALIRLDPQAAARIDHHGIRRRRQGQRQGWLSAHAPSYSGQVWVRKLRPKIPAVSGRCGSMPAKTGHVLVRTSGGRRPPKRERFQSGNWAMSGGLKLASAVGKWEIRIARRILPSRIVRTQRLGKK